MTLSTNRSTQSSISSSVPSTGAYLGLASSLTFSDDFPLIHVGDQSHVLAVVPSDVDGPGVVTGNPTSTVPRSPMWSRVKASSVRTNLTRSPPEYVGCVVTCSTSEVQSRCPVRSISSGSDAPAHDLTANRLTEHVRRHFAHHAVRNPPSGRPVPMNVTRIRVPGRDRFAQLQPWEERTRGRANDRWSSGTVSMRFAPNGTVSGTSGPESRNQPDVHSEPGNWPPQSVP